MNNLRRLTALMLAVVMVFTVLPASAFAVDGDSMPETEFVSEPTPPPPITEEDEPSDSPEPSPSPELTETPAPVEPPLSLIHI